MKRFYEIRKMKVLFGLLYAICLLNVMGISIKMSGQETQELEVDGTVKQNMNDTVKKNKVKKEAPKIALTFDDGPSEKCTGRLLDGLKERKVKASFFLIGESAYNNPELVKRIYKEGHLIGNHTYHHVELTKLSDEEARREINQTDEVISKITGEHVAYMRPPFGVWQKDLEVELEVMPVMWSVDPLDWTTENVSEIVNKVVTETEENDIILLHDCYDSSVDAALQIVDILKEEGFEFVTVDELLIN